MNKTPLYSLSKKTSVAASKHKLCFQNVSKLALTQQKTVPYVLGIYILSNNVTNVILSHNIKIPSDGRYTL